MAYQNPSTPSQSTTLLEPADERKRARVVGGQGAQSGSCDWWWLLVCDPTKWRAPMRA